MPTNVLAADSGNAGITQAVMMVALIAVFYFLMIRPQRLRAQKVREMQSTLAVGSEVITTAGVYGRIVAENEDDTVLLEIAPGVPIRMARAAIARSVDQPVTEDAAPAEPDEPPATA